MKKIVLGLVMLLLVVGSASVWSFRRPHSIGNMTDATLVKVSAVTVKDIPLSVSTTGTLQANQQANVSPKVGGNITSINFNEGQYVKAGTILINLDDSQQRQQYLSAEAQANLAATTYKRYLSLRKKNIVAPQDIDQYGADYKKALATQKANQITLDDMTIRAPIDGYLGAKSINIGDNVTVGQSLVTVTDISQLKIEYSLPSSYAAKVVEGQKVLITADFLPNKQWSGSVSYVSPFVDANTQTLTIHALLPNQQHLLKPGQSVNITQLLGNTAHAILVPSDAVMANINGNYVFQVKDGKVATTPIKIGEHYDAMTVILKGLTAQDKIITEGQFQVKDGNPVKIAQ